MKVGYQWLKDYVSAGVSVEEIARRLTMAGLEVEAVEKTAGDDVLELEITPNRPDCLNVVGLAREISAVLNKPLKLPKSKSLRYPSQICPIAIDDKQGCRRYVGTIIRNVSVGPASKAMTGRLAAIGLRAINNVVDITNFVLMETGQPLHAFDYDKLSGGKIIVRRAKQGEKIVTIDGVERALDSSILVIADDKRPVAIAGVMGGKETEVTGATKNILLESAYFDPVLIRRASRKLGLASDSSYRFERGVDMPTVKAASDRAAALILEQAGGKLDAYKDLYVAKKKEIKTAIVVKTQELNRRLGAPVPVSQCKMILQRLGFGVTASGQTLKVSPPSFRGDVRLPVDIVEEVARVIGYDRLPTSLPQVRISSMPPNPRWELKKIIRRAMTSQGFCEAITYSLISAASLERAGLKNVKGIAVQNPLSQDQALMRPSMLPSFLDIARGNINRGQKDLRLFEVGKVYLPGGERDTLAVVVTGARRHDWRDKTKEAADFYDLKGCTEALFSRLGLEDEVAFKPVVDGIFHSGEGADIVVNNQTVGGLGCLRKEILNGWDIKHDAVYFAQIDLPPLYEAAVLKRSYRTISGFPAVTRDVSLAVAKDVPFAKIKACVAQAGGELLTEVRFLEEYRGDKIPQGQRGLVFSLVYQAATRTLTEHEVTALHEKVLSSLTKTFQAVIR